MSDRQDAMRVAFETWSRADRLQSLDRRESGGYINPHTRNRWEGWRAATELNTDLLEALDNLAHYADTCELFLRDTHPGKASALRSRVSKAIAAITKATQGEVK